MQKNVAGQKIGVQMVSASDGSAFTGSVTVYVTGDAGTQAIGSVGSGICTHEGNGYHSYAPAQAETNYDLIAFTFVGSGAVPVTVQVYTAINPVTAVPTAADNATAVRSELGLTGSLDSAFGDIPTVSEFNARTIPAADYATAAQTTAIETDTQDIQTRLPAALVSGRMDASVGAMASNTLTAAALATDAVTEIQVGLATSSGVTAAFTEIKGATWSSSTDTLEAIRDASGSGGTSIMVTPVVAQVPVRVRDTDIETYIGDLSTIRIGIFSGEDAVDLSGFGDLEVCVQAKDGTDLDFVEMADLTIDGTDNNYVSWDPSGPSVATIRRGKWSLRKSSNKQVIAKGAWIVSDAALEDTGS